MTIQLSPELEARIQRDVADGGYKSADDLVEQAVLRYYAEQEESDEDRAALIEAIEVGWAAAERGELMDGKQAWSEFRAWRDEQVRKLGQ